jgi:adenylate cyclase
MAERKLPYDLVFILNRYFAVTGEAITRAGGRVDKFIGDGVMALFGVESGEAQGCYQAIAAAQQIVAAVDALSGALVGELAEPLTIGIGIHAGPAVVGRMGYGDAFHLTAIGDTVNVASRLQDLCKKYSCQMVISHEVASQAAIEVSRLKHEEMTVRNRKEALVIYVINEVQTLRFKETNVGAVVSAAT